MKFAQGNQWWKSRSRHGSKPIFIDAEHLFDSCYEYFEWADENPLIKYEVLIAKHDVVCVPVEKLRATSIEGLCVFLHISRATWRNYRRRPALRAVVEAVETAIWVHNFEAAVVGLLKANVLSRQLAQPSRYH